MFKKATCGLVHQVDPDGSLIPVSRLNDSKRLQPLAIVIKRKPTWFWQRPKYKPTDFTLNDIIQGKRMKAVLEEDVFTKMYEETNKYDLYGSGEIGMGKICFKAKGSRTSKLITSFETLNKETLNMPQFLRTSKNRKVDLQHILIQHTQGKPNQVLTVVKERIFTACDCIMQFSGLGGGNCSAILQTLQISPAEVHLKKSASIQYDTNVALEVPPHTVMAYSVSELIIKSDGSFVHCLSEVDGVGKLTQMQQGSSLCHLKNDLAGLKACLCVLANLPSEHRFTLLHLFRNFLSDHTLLSALQDRLERLCNGEVISGFPTEFHNASSKHADTFLEVLQTAYASTDQLFLLPFKQNEYMLEKFNQNRAHRGPAAEGKSKSTVANHNGMQTAHLNGSSCKAAEQNGSHSAHSSHNGSSLNRQTVMRAMHILVSAAEELTSDGLALLKDLCSSDILNWLNHVVTRLTNDPQHIPFTEIPFPQNDGRIPVEVEQLFSTSNIELKRNSIGLWFEMGNGEPVLPLVLCIVIHGLAYLNETSKVDIEL